jgi:hypothetical protein
MCGCMGIGRSAQRRKVTSGGSGWNVSWGCAGGGVRVMVRGEEGNEERRAVGGEEGGRTNRV